METNLFPLRVICKCSSATNWSVNESRTDHIFDVRGFSIGKDFCSTPAYSSKIIKPHRDDIYLGGKLCQNVRRAAKSKKSRDVIVKLLSCSTSCYWKVVIIRLNYYILAAKGRDLFA